MIQPTINTSVVNGIRWGDQARFTLSAFLEARKPLPIGRGNKGKSKEKRVKYLDCISAFDIETPSLRDLKQAFMYIWQWAFYDLNNGEWFVIYGREWAEWVDCVGTICEKVKEGQCMVVLDHNLSFEFQFLTEYYPFEVEEVFATDAHDILKCTMYGNRLEWRCTMRHSNTSLAVYTKQWRVEHQKLSGDDYGYEKIRYPWTTLTDDEMQYALHDVVGLCEAYAAEMKYWHDDLYKVPMTSTGYVRRIAKKEWARVNYNERRRWMPPLELFDLMEEGFRGGDVHANRLRATPEDTLSHQIGCVVNYGVTGMDRSSSFPDEMLNNPFPLGDWYRLQNGREWVTQEELERYIYQYEKAVITVAHFRGLHLAKRNWGMPYIPKSKCRFLDGEYVQDNGRIMSADFLSMVITDPDWEIIKREYAWDQVYFSDTWYCRKRPLPEFFLEVVREFYRKKTELKGAEEGSLEETEYGLYKALLNSLYGMSAQHALKNSVCYVSETGEYLDEIEYAILQENENRAREGLARMTAAEQRKFRKEKRQEKYDRYVKNAFMPYQIGVWVTAYARLDLHRAMWVVDEQSTEENPCVVVYVDTDSCKYIGNVDFSELNDFYKARSERSGAWAVDRKGKVHYMGVYEYEYTADFATMGAKKYCYRINGKKGPEYHVTIAGVNKKKGAKELTDKGGFSAFVSGTVFETAGGVQGVYNDKPYGTITREGHDLYIGRNVCLLPDSYTLGLSSDYARLLDSIIERGKIDGYTLGGNDDE